MRMAILGDHPSALESVQTWLREGAQVDWFIHDQHATPDWHCDLHLFSQAPVGDKTLQEYYQEHYLPALRELEQLGVVKRQQVLAVHKTFLAQDEVPPGKDRMHDTFRVVYEVIPSGDIGINAMGAPLPNNIAEHLQRPYERFIDVDLIIDCRGGRQRPLPAGPSQAPAIGERYLKNKLYPGLPSDQALLELAQNQGPLLLVGSGATAARWLCLLGPALFQREVTVVTQEAAPFAGFKQEFGHGFLRQSLDQLFARLQAERRGHFHFYLGHNVMGMDELQDQNDLFITIEAPAFRPGVRTAAHELKTLRASQMIIATGFLPDLSIYHGLQLQWNSPAQASPIGREPGLYLMSPGAVGAQTDFLAQARTDLELIKQDVERFFSKK